MDIAIIMKEKQDESETRRIKPKMMFFDLGDTIITANPGNVQASQLVDEYFRFLKGQGIRTAMITNNLFQDAIVQQRLDELLPEKPMEFIISSAVGIYPVWYKRYYTGHHKPAENLNYLRANNWQDIVDAIG